LTAIGPLMKLHCPLCGYCRELTGTFGDRSRTSNNLFSVRNLTGSEQRLFMQCTQPCLVLQNTYMMFFLTAKLRDTFRNCPFTTVARPDEVQCERLASRSIHIHMPVCFAFVLDLGIHILSLWSKIDVALGCCSSSSSSMNALGFNHGQAG
jgi:hypothetical protein